MSDWLFPPPTSRHPTDLELEAPLRTAAAMLTQRLERDFASTIIEGPMESHDVCRLELLVDRVAAECRLEGSLHLHARSYSVRFSHPRDGSAT
jgi:hypothetical protein